MNAFQEESPALKAAMTSAAKRVIDSGWYVLGEETKAFEKLWAEKCQTEYAIGVGNGMDAIEIILRSLDIGHADEVITTPMTAFATVLGIIRAGATPVLADIDINTGLLDVNSIARCINHKTRAVLLVHLYGQMRNVDQINQLCESRGVYLIEDCAQSHLACLNGRVSGSIGVAGAYSFYPTKNLGSVGDAGMIVTNNKQIQDRARQLRNYGQSTRYYHPILGINSRLDEIQAAILLERTYVLESFTNRRREIAQQYHKYIRNPAIKKLALPTMPTAHVYHLFVIHCEHRAELQVHLEGCGVQSLIHYPNPIHHQPPCLDILRDSQGLANSEKFARTCLSIPCHPQLSDIDVMAVIDAINKFST